MLRSTNYANKPGEEHSKKLAELAGGIIEKIVKINPYKVLNALKGENPFIEISKSKALRERINEFITELIPEHGNRLLIIIDELDRCNPKFAVTLLERIKHYFNNEQVTFVFSVNLSELQNTVRCFYGNEFNAGRYIDRFFDLRVALPKPDMSRFYETMGLYSSVYTQHKMILNVANKNNMPLRECSKFLSIIQAINNDYEKNSTKNDYPPTTNTTRLIVNFIVPIVLGTMILNPYLYHAFLNENDCSLFNFYLDDDTIESNIYTINALFTDSELTNNFLHTIGDRKKAEIVNRIKCFCNELTHGEGTNRYKACMITEAHRELFTRSITLMSKSLSDYNS